MKIVLRLFFLTLAVAVSVLEPSSVGRASSEIVTLSAIVSAGAVSALIFAGTIVGARVREKMLEGFEVVFWGNHQNYWFLLFFFSTATSVLVILGQMVNWRLVLGCELFDRELAFDFARIIAFLAVLSLGLAVALMMDFARAVRDIMLIASSSPKLNETVARKSNLSVSDVEDTIDSGTP